MRGVCCRLKYCVASFCRVTPLVWKNIGLLSAGASPHHGFRYMLYILLYSSIREQSVFTTCNSGVCRFPDSVFTIIFFLSNELDEIEGDDVQL